MPKRSHGMSRTRFYSIWCDMKRRCLGGSRHDTAICSAYKERGISLCQRWESFDNFKEDMYENYTDHLTLDRINPLEGYSKNNCRWIEMVGQSLNKSKYKSNRLGYANIFYKTNKDRLYLSCKITRNGQSFIKTIRLHGDNFEEALATLIDWRDTTRKILGFSEFHGCDYDPQTKT